MILDDLIQAELERIRPQLTKTEWFTLAKVIEASLTALAHAAYFKGRAA